MTNLAIIIVNYNTKRLTSDCLGSIVNSNPKVKYAIWVVDNNSSDSSALDIKKQFPQINLIQSDKNLGFSGGNNIALKKIDAEYYLLLNSDTKIENSAIDKLIQFAKKADFGIYSCKLLNPNGSFQPNAGELPKFIPLLYWLSGLDDVLGKIIRVKSYQARNPNYYSDNQRVGWVSGSVMLIKREVVKKIGYLDDKIFMYGEDVEYCWRAFKYGYKVGWTSAAEITHLGGASSDSPRYQQWVGEFKGLIYLYNKFYGWWAAILLKTLLYFFIAARIIGFMVFGKIAYSRIYAKIFINL